MKKHFKFFLILFVFCLSFTLCKILPVTFVANAEGEQVVSISSAEGLESFISSYGATDVEKTIKLTADINMSGKNLTSTIGTAENPFKGTFDGQGYKISNLSIDVSESGLIQYSALFGWTKNATIKNLAIENETIKSRNALKNYAGGIVGKAENTRIELCQFSGNLTFDSVFSAISYFGGLVGLATDNSLVKNCIVKPNMQTPWSLSDANEKAFYYGGIVGNIDGAKAIFNIVSTNIVASTTSAFNGTLYVGGVCGAISGANSEITNLALSNTISVTDNSIDSNVLVGQIAGAISNPVPDSSVQAISNMHYVENSNVSLFGNTGGYEFKIGNTHDNILPSSITDLSREFFTSENNTWHPLYGNFDFDKIWYGQETAQLQPFYGNFSVRVSSNLHDNIFEDASDLKTAYRYGESASMTFSFKEIEEQALSQDPQANANNPLYSDFYDLTSITRNSNEISKVSQDSSGNYVLSNSDIVSISTNLEAKTFTITIDSINMATDGIYNIIETAKNFNLSITSKGFDKDGEERAGEPPAWVYAYGSQTKRNALPNETMYFGKPSQNATYITEVKTNEPYAFDGWWIDNGDEDDERISTSQTIAINFGRGNFVSDVDIYARWVYNARIMIFDFSENVDKIVVSGTKEYNKDNSTKEDSGLYRFSQPTSKANSNFKVEVYVKKGFSIDIENFKKNSIYWADDVTAQEGFLSMEEKTKNGQIFYECVFDMSKLSQDKVDQMSLKFEPTASEKSGGASWVWIALGVGGGVIVIAGIVILIVVLRRRNGFGGGFGGGGSFKRNSFKGYY